MPRLFPVLAVVLFLWLGPAAHAQSLQEKVDAYLAPLVANRSFAGVVLIARDDTILVEKDYGLASAELSVPHRLEDRFQIASASKPITAAAVLKLASQGRLDLRAPIARLDSALNHSVTTADSAAHIAAARAIQIRTPDPESVEANVIQSYDQNLVTILAEADHPCNWQSELNQDE